jgi:hypothetical protein
MLGTCGADSQRYLSNESLARRVKAAVRFSRPTCLAAAVACGVPVDSELLASIQTPHTRATLRCRRDQRMLRGMGLRIVEPRASKICFALQSCRLPALLTMLIIDEACSSSSTSFECSAVGTQHLNHNDVLFPRHLLRHSCRGTTPTVAAHCSHGSLQRSRFEMNEKKSKPKKKSNKQKNHFFALQVVLPHCARASRRPHRALAVF